MNARVDPYRVEECLRRLEQADVVGYDVETSGLDWTRNFICGYVFSFGPNDEDSYYLPVRHKGGGNIPGGRIPEHAEDWSVGDDHPIEVRLRDVINKGGSKAKKRTWYAHKAKFDLHMSAKHNIWLYGDIEDTATMAGLIDENQGAYDLDVCAKIAGVTPKAGSDLYPYIAEYVKQTRGVTLEPVRRSTMGYYWETPAPPGSLPFQYALGDGVTMSQLRLWQLDQIEQQDLGLLFGIEKRVTRTLFRMERRGVPVHQGVLDRVIGSIGPQIERARRALPDGLNVRSGKQMRAFYDSLGFTEEQYKLTPGKAASFDEAWLEGKPHGDDILTLRKLKNLESTFITNAVVKRLYRGHVHPTFNQMKMEDYGTVTGRLSCSDPNFQQIPKRNKILAPLLRQIFRDGDLLWWSSDYSQQEYRVFADYAGAKYVLEAYERDPDTDYHQLVADLLGVERDPAAKRINLGVIYNMGAPSLAKNLGTSVDVARGYLRKMQQMMPEAKTFNKTAETIAKRNGFVRTLLKRRRRFPRSEFAHKAGNAVIQGSSADITKLKMVEIDEILQGDPCDLNPANSVHVSRLILQIHDALDFLYDPAEERVMHECMRVMNSFGPDDVIQLSVPMKTDVSQGPSWGHATFPKYGDFLEAA